MAYPKPTLVGLTAEHAVINIVIVCPAHIDMHSYPSVQSSSHLCPSVSTTHSQTGGMEHYHWGLTSIEELSKKTPFCCSGWSVLLRLILLNSIHRIPCYTMIGRLLHPNFPSNYHRAAEATPSTWLSGCSPHSPGNWKPLDQCTRYIAHHMESSPPHCRCRNAQEHRTNSRDQSH